MECLPKLVIQLGAENVDDITISLSEAQFQALTKVLGNSKIWLLRKDEETKWIP